MIMAMHAATVEILIEKAKFEPRVALAVAEAMDEAMDTRQHQTQLVTVPVLNERLAELRQEIKEIKADMVEMKWIGRRSSSSAPVPCTLACSRSVRGRRRSTFAAT